MDPFSFKGKELDASPVKTVLGSLNQVMFEESASFLVFHVSTETTSYLKTLKTVTVKFV